MSVEASILAEELGKLGGKGDRWVSRLLPMSEVNESLSVKVDSDELRNKVIAALEQIGYISSTMSNATRVSGVLGSGAFGLNPAILHICVKPTNEGSILELHSLAKEGLIKQGTARKAINAFKRKLEVKYA
jgi:hypothetical protein